MVLAEVKEQHVMQAFSLIGKVAAVTGGARGIGLEVSKGLAEAGAQVRRPKNPSGIWMLTRQVALIYSSTKNAADIAATMAEETGVTCKSYQADVSKPEQIDVALKQIEADFGRLDIVVANAGIASHHAAEDYTPEQFSEITKINLDGAFYTAQSASRIFKRQGSGNLIFKRLESWTRAARQMSGS